MLLSSPPTSMPLPQVHTFAWLRLRLWLRLWLRLRHCKGPSFASVPRSLSPCRQLAHFYLCDFLNKLFMAELLVLDSFFLEHWLPEEVPRP